LSGDQQRAEKKVHDEEMARLRLETAQIQERAANLEKEAAEARLSLGRLQTPRATLLTGAALDTIAEKLKPFAGTKFDTGLAADSGEQADFLWRLEMALTKLRREVNRCLVYYGNLQARFKATRGSRDARQVRRCFVAAGHAIR
jgi:hypothetical protein